MSELQEFAAPQDAWITLMVDLAVDEQSARDAYAHMAQRYAEPHRAYHTMSHVWQVLQDVLRLAPYAQKQQHVQLAAWLHDIVYEPRATDNEVRSANYAANLLRDLSQPDQLISIVQRLILLTRTHEVSTSDSDGQVLSDADLAILGAAKNAYKQYAGAIRHEYNWVDDAVYREGRISVLTRFLQRETIYYTPLMREEREHRARQNLQAEIRWLSRGG